MPEGFFDAGPLADANGVIESHKSENNQMLIRLWVPNAVKQIDAAAFKNCKNLVEIRFEDGGTSPLDIGLMAFEGCSSLSSVVLPSRLRSIGRACFRNCSGLQDFAIAEGGEAVFQMPLNVFDGCAGKSSMFDVLKSECNRCAAIQADIANAQLRQRRNKNGRITVESSMVIGNYRLYPRIGGNDHLELPESIPGGTLVVCVDKTWTAKYFDPVTKVRVSLEDCARGYWCVDQLRRAKVAACKYLMALSRKKIVGIWKIDVQAGWKNPEELPKQTWPSDKGPWKSQREGCLFLDDDIEIVNMRNVLVGQTLDVNFDQWQAVLGVFENQTNV